MNESVLDNKSFAWCHDRLLAYSNTYSDAKTPNIITQLLHLDHTMFSREWLENKTVPLSAVAVYLHHILTLDQQSFHEEWFNAKTALELISKSIANK